MTDVHSWFIYTVFDLASVDMMANTRDVEIGDMIASLSMTCHLMDQAVGLSTWSASFEAGTKRRSVCIKNRQELQACSKLRQASLGLEMGEAFVQRMKEKCNVDRIMVIALPPLQAKWLDDRKYRLHSGSPDFFPNLHPLQGQFFVGVR